MKEKGAEIYTWYKAIIHFTYQQFRSELFHFTSCTPSSSVVSWIFYGNDFRYSFWNVFFFFSSEAVFRFSFLSTVVFGWFGIFASTNARRIQPDFSILKGNIYNLNTIKIKSWVVGKYLNIILLYNSNALPYLWTIHNFFLFLLSWSQ